jgi:metal-responsive CopG/Arc/MetJ family transcriptional regulator
VYGACTMRPMKKKPMTMKLDAGLVARLDAHITTHEVAVTRTAVVEAAIREYLEARQGREARHAKP